MKDTLRRNSSRVRMIAHRGVSGLELENTASAFVAAGNRSYYGIETDVHRTLDGRFITIHDNTTGRVALDNLSVENTTYDTLRRLRLRDIDGKAGREDLILPSLEEYTGICKKYGKVSVLELKNHFAPEDIDAILESIRQQQWLENTIFIYFDLPNLLCIRDRLPHQRAQFLISSFPDWLPDTLQKYSLDLDIHFRALTEQRARLLRNAGVEINVWTVDTLEDAMRMEEYGVDYITSNILE